MSEQRLTAVSRDTIRTFIFNAAAGFVSVVTGIVVAKTLGPVGKGEFSGAQLLQAAVVAVTSGVGSGITYYLTKQRRNLADLGAPLIVIAALCSALTLAGLALWSLHGGGSLVLIAFAAGAPAIVILSWQQSLLLGLNRVQSLNVQTLGLALFTLAGVSAASAWHLGISGALSAWVICLYGGALVLVRQAILAARGPATLPFNDAIRQLGSYGARSGLYGLLGFFNYRIDSLVLIAFLGASGFGVYSVAVAAGELLFRVPRAITTATAYHVGVGDLADASAMTAKAIRLTTVVTGTVAVVLFIAAPQLIALLYGSQFTAAAPALRVLLPGIVAFASASLFNQFFALQLGRPMLVVYIALVMIALQLGTAVWLVPKYGLLGAATASTATYVAAAIMITSYFCRLTGFRAWAVWVPTADDFRILKKLALRTAP